MCHACPPALTSCWLTGKGQVTKLSYTTHSYVLNDSTQNRETNNMSQVPNKENEPMHKHINQINLGASTKKSYNDQVFQKKK